MTSMRTALGLTLGLSLLAAVGCEDPAKNKPKAEVAAPTTAAVT